MTLKKAREIVALWQAKLKLEHWSISVIYDRKLVYEDGASLCGCISWQPEYRQAQMHLNPKTHATDEELTQTIVHECIHLAVEGHQPKPTDYSGQYEFALNTLSELLCQSA